MRKLTFTSKYRSFKLILALLLLFSITPIFAQDINKSYDITFDHKIPMRDGVRLSVTVLLPSPQPEALPALFIFTPYTIDRYLPQAQYFAKNDYAVVISDIRGRGNSEGSVAFFDPVVARDGLDICEWISQQPWCNGKVGMLGGSYSGMVQWQILKEHPESLKTIVPTASVAPGVDFPFRNNIFYTINALWLTLVHGKTLNFNALAANNDFWNKVLHQHFTGKKPYRDLMKTSGLESNAFETWLEHPTLDSHWKRLLPTKQDYEKISVPVLTITGYYDDDQRGALHYYGQFMQYARSEVKKNHYFLIGPWNHTGTREPSQEIYDLKFGEQSVININKIHLDWFNWTLKEGKRPDFFKDRVIYYVMGEDKWQYAANSAEISNHRLTYYLSSENENAKDIFHSGHLDTSPVSKQKSDKIIYDPLDDTYFDLYLMNAPLVDMSLYRNNEAYKKNQLIYHSAPLSEDLIIAGQIKFSAFIEMNVKDTDFEYLMYEVRPDGTEIFLTTDILRARYRNSLEKEELIVPGRIYKYDFQTSYFIVRKIKKGSRLRFIFRALNNPFWQKNFNSGGKVIDETEEDAITAAIKLYHDNDHPSCIEIPIFKEER